MNNATAIYTHKNYDHLLCSHSSVCGLVYWKKSEDKKNFVEAAWKKQHIQILSELARRETLRATHLLQRLSLTLSLTSR